MRIETKMSAATTVPLSAIIIQVKWQRRARKWAKHCHKVIVSTINYYPFPPKKPICFTPISIILAFISAAIFRKFLQLWALTGKIWTMTIFPFLNPLISLRLRVFLQNMNFLFQCKNWSTNFWAKYSMFSPKGTAKYGKVILYEIVPFFDPSSLIRNQLLVLDVPRWLEDSAFQYPFRGGVV